MPRELVAVDGLELAQVHRRIEGQAEAGGASGGGARHAADREGRMGLRARRRCDADRHAVVLEGLAAPRFEERLEDVVHALSALVPVLVEGRVLDRAIADAGDEAEAAAAREVEDRDVLGELDRVVERQRAGRSRSRRCARSARRSSPRAGAATEASRSRRRGAPRRSRRRSRADRRRPPCRGRRGSASTRPSGRRQRPVMLSRSAVENVTDSSSLRRRSGGSPRGERASAAAAVGLPSTRS